MGGATSLTPQGSSFHDTNMRAGRAGLLVQEGDGPNQVWWLVFILQWLCPDLDRGIRASRTCASLHTDLSEVLCRHRQGRDRMRVSHLPRDHGPPLNLAPASATSSSADPGNRKLIDPDSPLVNQGWDSTQSWFLARENLRPPHRHRPPEVVSSLRPLWPEDSLTLPGPPAWFPQGAGHPP